VRPDFAEDEAEVVFVPPLKRGRTKEKDHQEALILVEHINKLAKRFGISPALFV